jgi:hypothetical protein
MGSEKGKDKTFDGGFAPSFLTHVRWRERGAPVQICGCVRVD